MVQLLRRGTDNRSLSPSFFSFPLFQFLYFLTSFLSQVYSNKVVGTTPKKRYWPSRSLSPFFLFPSAFHLVSVRTYSPCFPAMFPAISPSSQCLFLNPRLHSLAVFFPGYLHHSHAFCDCLYGALLPISISDSVYSPYLYSGGFKCLLNKTLQIY